MFDFHIHTKYSSCSVKHGPYDLIQAYHAVREHGFDGMGVSDHCNYRGYSAPAKFLKEQRELIKSNKLSDSLLLGLEISIINKKGDLGVNPAYLKMLDYYIISEHCHLNRMFSDFYHLNSKFIKWVSEGNNPKIQKTIDFLTELMTNSINKNPYTIFAHIWRFTRHRAFYSTTTLDKTDLILDALQSKNVALELHASMIGALTMSKKEDEEVFERIKSKVSSKLHDNLISPKLYVEEIIKRSLKYNLFYAIGSDAHQIKNIGQFGNINNANWLKSFLIDLGIKESKLVTPKFFQNKK